MYIDRHQQTKLKRKIEAESENHHILKLSIDSWPSGSSGLFGGKTVCSEFFCSRIYVEIIAREQWKYIYTIPELTVISSKSPLTSNANNIITRSYKQPRIYRDIL